MVVVKKLSVIGKSALVNHLLYVYVPHMHKLCIYKAGPIVNCNTDLIAIYTIDRSIHACL